MPISNEDKLDILSKSVKEMALLGYRLDKLLEGFKLYQEYKGTTDIGQYELLNTMYEDGIKAMEEQMQRYHRLFSYLKELVVE